jgi:hypothetical protein
MQKEIIEVKLQFDKGDEQLKVGYIPLAETAVYVKPIVKGLSTGCLLVRRHNYLQTQFIMTGSESCCLMIFDERGEYVSIRHHDGRSSGPFSSFIPELFVLILPQDSQQTQLKPLYLELAFPAPDLLCKNKFGVYESLDDQCGATYTCIEGCKLDDLIFEDAYLHQVYLANMRRDAKRKNKND